MGQYLNCQFVEQDTSSQLKHRELIQQFAHIHQQNNRNKQLCFQQRQREQIVGENNSGNQSMVVHDHILRLSAQSFPKSMEHSSGGFIQIPEISLSDILESKINTNQFFSSNDIRAILGGLLSAMTYLETNNINHHDIYPSNIYYSNNRYKLSNPTTSQSSYQRTFNQRRFSYLSPELIDALVNNVVINDHTLFFKPDVYSLGMVMLEVCSLKSSSQCYDPETYRIIEIHITNRLNAIQARYGMSTTSLIKSMLEKDAKKRMTAAQIFEVFEILERREQNNQNMNRSITIDQSKVPTSILKNSTNLQLSTNLNSQQSQYHGLRESLIGKSQIGNVINRRAVTNPSQN